MGEDYNKLTIAELKLILEAHDVDDAKCKVKADYLQLANGLAQPNPEYIGQDFDEFLEEVGLTEEVKASVAKGMEDVEAGRISDYEFNALEGLEYVKFGSIRPIDLPRIKEAFANIGYDFDKLEYKDNSRVVKVYNKLKKESK